MVRLKSLKWDCPRVVVLTTWLSCLDPEVHVHVFMDVNTDVLHVFCIYKAKKVLHIPLKMKAL